jgi:hypothetical protein
MFPLKTKKLKDYKFFKKAYYIIINKEHLTSAPPLSSLLCLWPPVLFPCPLPLSSLEGKRTGEEDRGGEEGRLEGRSARRFRYISFN